MRLCYLVIRGGAQVVAKLFEVDLATGGETARLTFNSNDPSFAAANGYQVQSFTDCGPGWRFYFKRNAYYIELHWYIAPSLLTAQQESK